MRMRIILVPLVGWLACAGPGTSSRDAGPPADAARDAGDLAQPMALCRAAQGLTGTPLLCVDMDKQLEDRPPLWNLTDSITACPAQTPDMGGWAIQGSGTLRSLSPRRYALAGTDTSCRFKIPDLTEPQRQNKGRLRIALEHIYQPGMDPINSYALIRVGSLLAPVDVFYPTRTAGQPTQALFEIDMTILPSMGNVALGFELNQKQTLTSVPRWEIRSMAVLVE